MKILIAEDDAVSRKLLQTVLSREGYEVSVARDGREAWEIILQPEAPRLAVLDWMMPNHDGTELCRNIREDDNLKGMYVILLTARSEDESIVDGLDAGADDYVLKPFKRGELLARIAAGIRVLDLQAKLANRSHDLEQALEELNLMMAHAQDFIYRLNGEGRCVAISPSVERVLGIPAEEWRQTPFGALTDHPANKTFRERDLKTMEGGTFQIETNVRKGAPLLLEIIERPCIEKGKMEGVVGVARDVTQRVRAEDQLRQSQKFEAIGKLAGGVAHEFNNLLLGIQMNAELLKEELCTRPSETETVNTILASLKRGSELTQHIISFSQQQHLSPQTTTLNEIIDNIYRIVRRVLGEDIKMKLDLSADPWPVHIDALVMEQAIMNLALNARDAMPEGGQLILRSGNLTPPPTETDLPGGNYVQFEMIDSGRGISKENLSNIFEPFFTTKEVGAGTGLGLSMVHGFVNQSGGRISVDSTPGKGTRVAIIFPRETVPAGEKTPEEEKKKESPTDREEATILLVEDDELVRTSVRKSLEKRGFRILLCESAEEALAMEPAFEGRIDLVLSDIVMPGLTGPEMFEKIKNHRPETTVLFMSGYPRTDLEKRSKDLGKLAYLPKPFTTEGLLEEIEKALEKKG